MNATLQFWVTFYQSLYSKDLSYIKEMSHSGTFLYKIDYLQSYKQTSKID